MHKEAGEAGEVCRRLLSRNKDLFQELGAKFRANPPKAIITNARGSSDHAGVFGKYVYATQLGIPVIAGSPSLASVYGAPMQVEGMLTLSISQSGQSPDIVRSAEALGKAGAETLAFVNVEDSPLARASTHVIALHAGPETSVAATKSYIASLVGQLALVAHWKQDDALLAELDRLPDLLEKAAQANWGTAFAELQSARGLYILGRGTSLGVANEAALKFKETCQIHGESFSTAECSHGPLALLGPTFPALVFVQDDATAESARHLITRMVDMGAKVLVAGPKIEGTLHLPVPEAHPLLQPILMIQSFYPAVADLALSLGCNPDQPPALRKVTETV
nr:SIS domain-containing protein [Woodsholea maritima]